jgi:hydroxymethyl cephem carbamoyltransferase
VLIAAVKPGHDGAVAILEDDTLLVSLEAEKDSFPRHETLTPTALLNAAACAPRVPDVIAVGGWHRRGPRGFGSIEAEYLGVSDVRHAQRAWFGQPVRFFTSSHERSHVMMAVGMAPDEGHDLEAVLVWEGVIGAFYLVDRQAQVIKTVPVLSEPGSRYAFLYGLADPDFPDEGADPDIEHSGKLMALSSFASAGDADAEIVDTVTQILEVPELHPAPKAALRHSPVYNAGVEATCTKIAGALLTERLFERFLRAAEQALPRGLPLRISGGCGLNCHWNMLWRRCGYFSSVFIPPCANDAGSAIGTAIDALSTFTGRHRIKWRVDAGLDFEMDAAPDRARWTCETLDHAKLASCLAQGDLVAWVQGRWEIGPRALGHRSLLGEPFHERTRQRLNTVKAREAYRPIAPCCRMEDVGRLFEDSFEDPHMMFARRVRVEHLRAVTHVDGTARLQTVNASQEPVLHALLSACAARSGDGVLCNTSLNFKHLGFVNRASDLIAFCEPHGIEHMVIGETWFRRA